jgi:hypothetical protein
MPVPFPLRQGVPGKSPGARLGTEPQEAVDGAESRSLCSPLEKGELLTQGQVLEREVGAALQRRTQGGQQGEHEGHAAIARTTAVRPSTLWMEFWQTTGPRCPTGREQDCAGLTDSFQLEGSCYCCIRCLPTVMGQGVVDPASRRLTASKPTCGLVFAAFFPAPRPQASVRSPRSIAGTWTS